VGQSASDESYKDPTNLQAKIQKHQAFEAEVAAHSNAIVVLDNTGSFTQVFLGPEGE
jgi:spectrin alpha